MCDLSEIPWDMFTAAIGWIYICSDRAFCRRFKITTARVLFISTLFHPNYQRSFLRILCHTCVYLCTDPRDQVFALLGHPPARQPETGALIMSSDYSKSANEIYWVLAVEIVQLENSLDLLVFK
jgi:hypothetical protein